VLDLDAVGNKRVMQSIARHPTTSRMYVIASQLPGAGIYSVDPTGATASVKLLNISADDSIGQGQYEWKDIGIAQYLAFSQSGEVFFSAYRNATIFKWRQRLSTTDGEWRLVMELYSKTSALHQLGLQSTRQVICWSAHPKLGKFGWCRGELASLGLLLAQRIRAAASTLQCTEQQVPVCEGSHVWAWWRLIFHCG
jgi:hypothetical protein